MSADKRLEFLRKRVEQAIDDARHGLFSNLSKKELLQELNECHEKFLMQNDDLQESQEHINQQIAEIDVLFNYAPVAYFVVDMATGAIERVNQLAEQLLTEEELNPRCLITDLYSDDSADIEEWLNADQSDPKRVVAPSGKGWHQLEKGRYGDSLILLTVSDISELVEEQERCKAASAEMESQKARLTQSFAVAANEMNTPLASLLMMLETQKVGELEPYGSTILSSAQHLKNVLEDLSLVINPLSPASEQKRVDRIFTLVERVITSMQYLFNEKKISLTFQSDEGSAGSFYFRPQAVRLILINLLKNAATHSGATRVSVNLLSKPLSGGQTRVRIQVVDNGVGIPSERLGALFKSQGADSTDSPGFATGLSVSEQLAEQIGGKLEVQSKDGYGTRFVLELVLDQSDAPDTTEQKAQEPEEKPEFEFGLQGKRLLLVDDDQLPLILMRRPLESLGAKVKVAHNGLEALDTFKSDSFDAVVSDLYMPEMDGLELLQALRKLDANLPIIIATGGVPPDVRQRLIDNGATDVLIKPLYAEQVARLFIDTEAE